MFSPSLEFLRRVVSPEVSGFKAGKIKTNAGPSAVQRVFLEYPRKQPGIATVILKSIGPHWPDDAYVQDREVNFYVDLLPRVGLHRPALYHAGIDEQTGERLIVLEDLSNRYRFPSPAYIWQPAEIRCFLRTYACLHVHGRGCLPPANARAWLLTYQQPQWDPEDVLTAIVELVGRNIWEPVSGADRLVAAALAGLNDFPDQPVTLLHNDLYPPNIGLPGDLGENAVLIDWEMGGWGLAEFDLAYLFMQPFQSACRVGRQEVLEAYWSHRQDIEGRIPAAGERTAALWLAEALFALAMVMVAIKVAHHPYPPGSAPHAYWAAMFGVLEQRLRELCRSV
jgi:hypothetical protein